jgi:hypothetical protein
MYPPFSLPLTGVVCYVVDACSRAAHADEAARVAKGREEAEAADDEDDEAEVEPEGQPKATKPQPKKTKAGKAPAVLFTATARCLLVKSDAPLLAARGKKKDKLMEQVQGSHLLPSHGAALICLPSPHPLATHARPSVAIVLGCLVDGGAGR